MFLDELERIAKITKAIIKQKNVKIISDYDCDGIVSAAIISKMLIRENVNFELKIVEHLTSDEIKSLEIDENDFIILTDLGSGQLQLLRDILDKTQVLILDHHLPVRYEHLNLLHVNPLLFGEEEICSSMICYLFAKFVNIKNIDLIDLAIVGGVADVQDERWDFTGMAKGILEEAESIGKVSITKGLRLYGRNTRPIHKSLAYSFDPFIPGISGSESQAVQFLSELDIQIKQDDEWRKLSDLTIEEQKKLASAIIIERLKTEQNAVDVFGETYTLLGKPEEIQDAREFATLTNACGRTGNSDVAFRLCLGDMSVIPKSWDILDEYRKLLSDGMSWLRENKNAIVATNFCNYILAHDKILPTIIGTLTSLVLTSNITDSSKPIFGFADTENGKVKISARASKKLDQINLGIILSKAAQVVDGEGGGHQFAAGALISKEKEQKFIETVDSLIGESIGSQKS